MPPAVLAAGIMGGSGILGGLLGNRKSDEEKGLMSAQTNAANQQAALSKQMGILGQRQFNMAQPAYGAAMGYYKTLLGGDRSAMSQAVAPDRANINDIYSGSERNLERLGVRGGEAVTAKADLARQQAGQLASLIGQVRPNAAASLGQLGLSGTGQAGSMMGGAAGAAGGASSSYMAGLQNLQNQRQLGFENMFGLGTSLSKLFLPYLLKSSASSGSFSPSVSTSNWGG